ncbi:anti-sigma B factor antagonist [Pseudorhodobacter antarcticus]|jgi:anti-sigma B factor antagonist|uniref:Anti-sigma B factor antagonist n=1 Tax=Pseudorhodobacter antarcticus TaxID=1077947 RepID=A0A1H8HK66_9RHOB|nr:STAS domain-containing protein [Pseudorhodobacter antarcticus]SEN56622.1 anti-sigma B factor antagonist [Pseudorhodobacter antarcticus]
MNLTANLHTDLLVVTCHENRIDSASAIQFKERMRDITETPSARVMLDLSNVAFLDSSGLGAVVAVMKLLGPDRKLELAGLTPTVAKVFRLTRMDTVFTIHATLPDNLRKAG